MPSASIWIRDGKRGGYCDKHLDMGIRKHDRIVEKRFKAYEKASSVDPVEIHIKRYDGAGGCFIAWPIKYVVGPIHR